MSNHFEESVELGKAESTLAKIAPLTIDERMAAIILEEISAENINDNLKLLLTLEYTRLQKLIQDEKNKSAFFTRLLNIKNESTLFARFIASLDYFLNYIADYTLASLGYINLASMVGTLANNVFSLIAAITTAIASVTAALTVLVVALPFSLSTLLIGVGVEFFSALFNPKTPLRKTVLLSDFAMLGLAATAFLMPLGIVPFATAPLVIAGLSFTAPFIPLIFLGVTILTHFKDHQQLAYKKTLIDRNNQKISEAKGKLLEHIRSLPQNETIDTAQPKIQRLSLRIAEVERENAILAIECETLTKTSNLHKISYIAIALLLVSGIIFPPLGLGIVAASVSVVCISALTYTTYRSFKNKQEEKQSIDKLDRTIIGEKQENAICNAMIKRNAIRPQAQPVPTPIVTNIISIATSRFALLLSKTGLFGDRNQQRSAAPGPEASVPEDPQARAWSVEL